MSSQPLAVPARRWKTDRAAQQGSSSPLGRGFAMSALNANEARVTPPTRWIESNSGFASDPEHVIRVYGRPMVVLSSTACGHGYLDVATLAVNPAAQRIEDADQAHVTKVSAVTTVYLSALAHGLA